MLSGFRTTMYKLGYAVFSALILYAISLIAVDGLWAQTPNCDFTVNVSTSVFDGRSSPYNQVQPGDTVCISSGTRGTLTIKNISGTVTNPITFINSGGQVIFNTSSGYGFFIANAKHFRITGTGSPGFKYGIFVQKALTFGLLLGLKSEYFEIDHLEFTELLGSTIAVHAITNASCPAISRANEAIRLNNDDWDYNGDGLYNELDVVSRDNFTQHNLFFHDNYFHGFTKADNTSSLQLAYYIGNSNYSTIPYTRSCNNPDGSVTTEVVVVNPAM